MPVAQSSHVADRLGRPLTPDEETQVEAYLLDAEALILSRLPNAVTRAGTDSAYEAAVISVECAVVLRAVRVSDGVGYVAPGTEDVSAIPSASRTQVYVKRDEWRTLGRPMITTARVTPGSRYGRTWVGWTP